MTTETTFSFLTAQDEYHCILEKILSRGSKFYFGLTQNIGAVLIENYIQMEKACLKEDYPMASFYYIKQLEEIILFGLNSVGLQRISNDLREPDNQTWKLSALGNTTLNYTYTTKNGEVKPNEEIINKLKKNQTLELLNFSWRDKIKLCKYYFDTKGPDFVVDELLYYKRNHYGHAKPNIKQREEQQFALKFQSCFQFMNYARINLEKYASSLMLPINR